MEIIPIKPIKPIGEEVSSLTDKRPTNVVDDFQKLLKEEINRVDNLQKKSIDLQKKLATGEIQDIHQVMIAAEEASIALQMTMQVRTKLIEAYQEIMRMQV